MVYDGGRLLWWLWILWLIWVLWILWALSGVVESNVILDYCWLKNKVLFFLGIKDDDLEIYVNKESQNYKHLNLLNVSLPSSNGNKNVGIHENENEALGPSFPIRDDDFQMFENQDSLEIKIDEIITEKSYKPLNEREYQRIHSFFKNITGPHLEVPSIVPHLLMVEDEEEFLECLKTKNHSAGAAVEVQWGTCSYDKVEYEVDSNIYTYVDPFTRNKDPKSLAVGWRDGTGIIRKFLLDCSIHFQQVHNGIDLSTVCLEGRGRRREMEFFQVIRTYGMPTWRFRSLGFLFVGVLRFEEIEKILGLKGNETHPSIRIKSIFDNQQINSKWEQRRTTELLYQ